ncbi:hypothetical protein D9O50_10495 [Oxalobacteraceae bacterium CAVE-383]|nr:hypothetical protein D9O50_10495 [Oxalobacteraceae bacterium CAVE-383]
MKQEIKREISKDKVAAALKQEELGVPLEDIIREMGVTRETYLGWRRDFSRAAAPAGGQPPDCNIKIPDTGKK